MNIKRKNDNRVCKIEDYYFGEEKASYITFSGIESTGIVSHLFTTRLGGVSAGEFSQMNLSFTRGDDREALEENYRRVAKILGCRMEDFVCADQTHTTNVRVVTKEDCGKGVTKEKDYTDVDGLITNIPGIVLGTFFADCVPLFVLDPVHRAIGMSHSGWRGTVHKMGLATLKAMEKEYGTKAADVRVAIGPSICQDCYEVSEDVAQEFIEAFGEQGKELLYATGNGKYQLNLQYANRLIFLEAGVPLPQIEETDLCTCCNPELFHSHRASHGRRGNLGAFMMLK